MFPIKGLGLILLATALCNAELKSSMNKLFFLGPNVNIVCPLEATFYQWKKYHNDKMTNIFQDDKRKLNISLKIDDSPTTYECGATSGFEKRNVNITVYILDRNSKKAQELCYVESIDGGSNLRNKVEYPCFINYQNQTVNRLVKGSSTVFDCEASGTNVNYTWFKLNTPNSHKDLLIKYNNSSVMEINNADEKSVGQYLCVVNANSGKKLQRAFELYLSEDAIRGNSVVSVESSEYINITTNVKNQRLDCSTKVPIKDKIQAVQWGKKLEIVSNSLDKSQTISWEGNSYKLLPENQILDQTVSESKVISSFLFKQINLENTGEYICVIVTNSGSVKYKTFYVNVSTNSPEEEIRHNFFFLYILIPSLIIAICLFIGIYLTINRRPARKSSNFNSNTKSESEAVRLRSNPDYPSVQYQANPPTNNVQFSTNHNYYNPYYPNMDKLVV